MTSKDIIWSWKGQSIALYLIYFLTEPYIMEHFSCAFFSLNQLSENIPLSSFQLVTRSTASVEWKGTPQFLPIFLLYQQNILDFHLHYQWVTSTHFCLCHLLTITATFMLLTTFVTNKSVNVILFSSILLIMLSHPNFSHLHGTRITVSTSSNFHQSQSGWS